MKKYIYQLKFIIILEIFFSLIESISLALMAYLPKLIFDNDLSSLEAKSVIPIILLYILCGIISIATIYAAMLCDWKIGIRFENLLKRDYFRAILNLGKQEFYKHSTSEYISLQSNDITQIEQDYLCPLISSINAIIKVVVFGIVMLLGVDWRITCVIVSLSLIAAILPKYTGKMTSKKRVAFLDNVSKYTDTIYDFFNGFKEINSRCKGNIISSHHAVLDITSKSRLRYGKSRAGALAINEIARKAVELAGFVLTVILLLHNSISLGTAVATLGFINSFIEPLEDTLYNFTTMASVKDTKDKIFNLLSKTSTNYTKSKQKFTTKILVDNISVVQGDFKINNLSTEFQYGKSYAIVGHNGSGKSTLINTILGYVPYTSGKISIDGDEIINLDTSALVTYVPQKSHIFNANYMTNVTMFSTYPDLNILNSLDLPTETVNKICSQEDCTNLSGGEKQILAYMRARNSNTPILILDEPFSAVDAHIKEILFNDVTSLKDKLVIMICHESQSTLDKFSYVISLANGEIISCHEKNR